MNDAIRSATYALVLLEPNQGAEAVEEAVEQEASETHQTSGVLTARGADYAVTVTYNEDAGIPDGATLSVAEVPEGSDAYEEYRLQAIEALKSEGSVGESETVQFARFFDVRIMHEGQKLEPLASVTVTIQFDEAVELGADQSASAVHFADTDIEVLDAQTNGDEVAGDAADTLSFEQDSFSVTGTVVTGTTDLSGDYMIVAQQNGKYYACEKDGNKVEVSFNPSTKQVTYNGTSKVVWTFEQQYDDGRYNYSAVSVKLVKGIEIIKTDMEDKVLKDPAKFKLYRRVAPGETKTKTLTVGGEDIDVIQVGDELTTADGAVTVEQLAYGTGANYYLEETEAPEGYLKLDEPVTITINLTDAYTDLDKKPVTEAQISSIPYNWTQEAELRYGNNQSDVNDDGRLEVRVKNSDGAELPAAGGPGNAITNILGAMAISAVLFTNLLLLRRELGFVTASDSSRRRTRDQRSPHRRDGQR